MHPAVCLATYAYAYPVTLVESHTVVDSFKGGAQVKQHKNQSLPIIE